MSDIKTWKKDFLASRKKDDESPTSIAQRFINIYRQLSILGEDAVKRYNTIIMEQSTPEVLIALTSLPGGEEIREYINFLEHKDLQEREELEEKENQKAKLPKAEELSPLWETMGMTIGSNVAQSVLATGQRDIEKIKQNIMHLFKRQNEQINHVLKYIIVDSDIEKMQQTLNAAIQEISTIQTNNETILENLFLNSSFDIPKQENKNTPSEKKISTSIQKTNLSSTQKNKPLHPIPKYSVNLIEEDDT